LVFYSFYFGFEHHARAMLRPVEIRVNSADTLNWH